MTNLLFTCSAVDSMIDYYIDCICCMFVQTYGVSWNGHDKSEIGQTCYTPGLDRKNMLRLNKKTVVHEQMHTM